MISISVSDRFPIPITKLVKVKNVADIPVIIDDTDVVPDHYVAPITRERAEPGSKLIRYWTRPFPHVGIEHLVNLEMTLNIFVIPAVSIARRFHPVSMIFVPIAECPSVAIVEMPVLIHMPISVGSIIVSVAVVLCQYSTAGECENY